MGNLFEMNQIELLNIILAEVQRRSRESGSLVESAIMDTYCAGFEALFAGSDRAAQPLVVAHVHDVLVSYQILYRIEHELWREGLIVRDKDENVKVSPLFEPAVKARERYRKAMKDLEDICVKSGVAVHEGLPDEFEKLMKKAEGVLEEALRTLEASAES